MDRNTEALPAIRNVVPAEVATREEGQPRKNKKAFYPGREAGGIEEGMDMPRHSAVQAPIIFKPDDRVHLRVMGEWREVEAPVSSIWGRELTAAASPSPLPIPSPARCASRCIPARAAPAVGARRNSFN